jgi:2-aminoadipate transaminase
MKMTELPDQATAATPPLAARVARARSSVIRELLKLTQRPEVISFAGGLPAPELFPATALRAALDSVLDHAAQAALQYGPTEGLPALREWVARRESARGVPTDPDDVLIVSGSQQALDLIGKALIDPGSPVMVESPTYLGALQAFEVFEPRFRSVPVDDDGIRADMLDEALTRGARFLYAMPSFQNPTGRTMTPRRRQALADAARRHDFWIVEDDPYGELWYRQAPPPGLRALAPERTVRLGSFSKILAPGLRLGFVIAPRTMLDPLVRLKQATDLHTSTLAQHAAAAVLQGDMLESHLERIRTHYAGRCACMLESLATSMPPSVRWTDPAGGMFVWVTLPETIDAGRLLERAIGQGVAFVPGAPFFAGAPQVNTLRLSFVTVPPERIAAGVRTLAGLIREMPGS